MSYHYNQINKSNKLKGSGFALKTTLHNVYIFGQKYISFKRKENNHIDFGIKSLFSSWLSQGFAGELDNKKSESINFRFFITGRNEKDFASVTPCAVLEKFCYTKPAFSRPPFFGGWNLLSPEVRVPSYPVSLKKPPNGGLFYNWSKREDLNLRPLRPERSALPG